VFARELEASRREKRLAKREEALSKREALTTELRAKLKALDQTLEAQRVQQVEAIEKIQKWERELEDKASNIALAEENLKEKDASLDRRETDLAWQEKDLAFREEMFERRETLLAEHELEAEENERKLEEWVRQFEAAQAALGPQVAEAAKKALEDLQAEHRAGVQWIAEWVGKASTALVPLGISPIPVSGPPASISDALPVLDSAAERLRRLEQILGTRLEVEGSRLCRAVVDYVLTCSQSHDPAMSLAPVLDGPVAATEDAARESIQDVVEMVAARFQRDPADAE
jgi:DNA repair exonuclease SbcCD ATPase subunit